MFLNKKRLSRFSFSIVIILNLLIIVSCSSKKDQEFHLTVRLPMKLSSFDLQSGVDRVVSKKTEKILQVSFIKNSLKWLFERMYDPISITELRYTAMKIGNNQFPKLRKLVEKICKVLHIDKRIDIFIYPGNVMDSFITNINNPCLVLSSQLLSHMPREELIFIIGRELGHIKCDNVLLQVIIKVIRKSLNEPGFIKNRTIELMVNLGFMTLLRISEEIADRAGLIACQNIHIAERALVRLFINYKGKDLKQMLNLDEYRKRIKKEMKNVNIFSSLRMKLLELRQPHPFIPQRILKIHEYSRSKFYKSIQNQSKGKLTYSLN